MKNLMVVDHGQVKKDMYGAGGHNFGLLIKMKNLFDHLNSFYIYNIWSYIKYEEVNGMADGDMISK